MMAANTKDFRCQKLPNHLQNPHLLRYTLLTVKYTALFLKRQNNDQNQKRRLHQTFYSIRVSRTFLEGKTDFLDGQNSRILEGRRIFTVQNC